jgi:hypothetical protein
VARRTVRLEVLGSADEAEQLRVSLGELFGRMAVTLEPSPAGGEPGGATASDGAAIVAQVDLRDPGVALVRLAWASTPFGESRTVPQRGSRTVLLEETALVVYAGSESLFNEGFASTPPPAPPPLVEPAPSAEPPPPPPVPQERETRRSPERSQSRRAAPSLTPWLLEGAMLVGSRAFASNASMVTGFGLGARWHVGASPWIPGGWLLGEFHFPFSGRQQGVELSTSVWSLRLEPSLELLRQGGFRLELGVGGGADVFVLAPTSSPTGATSTGHRRDVSPIVAGLVAGSLATSSASRVVLAATFDYDLAPRRYLVAQGAQSWVLLEPWRFRPALSLGFLFEVASGGAKL